MSLSYEFGPFQLDPARRLLTRNGETVSLPPKTYELLLLLVRSEGRALPKQELMSALWPDTFVEEANLSFQVTALRKTLGEEWVETVPRHGYRFGAAVTKVEGAGPRRVAESPPPSPLRHLVPWLLCGVAGVTAATFALLYFRATPLPERTA